MNYRLVQLFGQSLCGRRCGAISMRRDRKGQNGSGAFRVELGLAMSSLSKVRQAQTRTPPSPSRSTPLLSGQNSQVAPKAKCSTAHEGHAACEQAVLPGTSRQTSPKVTHTMIAEPGRAEEREQRAPARTAQTPQQRAVPASPTGGQFSRLRQTRLRNGKRPPLLSDQRPPQRQRKK